ncbi:carbohydrate ABC transporter permease [Pseudarthrobacter sp. NIBRBAC000502772]|uniref:carbohydrate ABC transporter permease n=1 Tax=Pseudarthrobacter sp. NIBRBAC000502772 TaxID=2590775 RepID=UPI0011303B18|nr:carbohydrate ABC transporter permease [Pseudarthrobacter sp. NIBRBAC000502772]QDG66150.1 carbohydrate ABC transporter permease [Pseudarthrobacter sp. NIBRBAC000502772]
MTITASVRSVRKGLRTRTLIYILATLGLVVTLAPFAWMILGSIKPTGEILADPNAWLPKNPTLDNFTDLLSRQNFGLYFFNSVVVAVACVIGNLLFCAMAGYALAKIDFAGKRLLFSLVLLMLIVPGIATFVPLFVQVSNLGLANTYLGLILPYIVTPLGVFLMRQFIGDIPDALLEAAKLDGAGEIRTFFRLILPLSGPALATLAILTFLAQWNNFLWPLVIAQTDDMYTLPVALALFSIGANGTNYGLLLAGAVVVVLPIIVVFLFLQRYFIQGIANTGIK